MKAALGLTDRELEALEEELLADSDHRGWNKPPVATSRPLTSSSENDLNLERGPSEKLYAPGDLARHSRANSISSAGGKRRRKFASGKDDGDRGHRFQERRPGARRPEIRPTERDNISSPTRDCTDLEFPTPRVLRRVPYTTLGAELAASMASTARLYPGEGKHPGVWNATGDSSLKNTAGIHFGAHFSTEQLAAATAGLGMAKLLELRRELGRSVGQVKNIETLPVNTRTTL